MTNQINAGRWRTQGARYRLTGTCCVDCGLPVFPPRPHCPECATRNNLKDCSESIPDYAMTLFNAGELSLKQAKLEPEVC